MYRTSVTAILLFSFFVPSVVADSKDDIAPLKSTLMKFSDSGLTPSKVVIGNEKSIVLLLNDTSDSKAKIALDFKKHVLHCHSEDMELDEHGVLRSTKAFGPKNFTSFCFHEKGEYELKISGLKNHPGGLRGVIEVR